MLNLTPARVQQLAKAGVIPRAQRGLYPLWDSITAYIRYLQKESLGLKHSDAAGTAAHVRDPDSPRARLAVAKARQAEIEAALAEGAAISLDAAKSVCGEIFVKVRTALTTLPASVPADAQAQAQTVTRACLEALADDATRLGESLVARHRRDAATAAAPQG